MPSFSEVSFAQGSVAGGNGSPPTANLALWLSAGAGLTLSGTDVTTWADQSGNGKNASASGTERPTYLSSGINGMPAISFNGTTNSMTGSQVLTGISATTLFAVVNFPVFESSGMIFQQEGFQFYRGYGGSITGFVINNGADLPSSGGVTDNTWVLLEGIANGGSSTLFLNGVQQASGDAGSSTMSGSYALAKYFNAPKTMIIAEMIIYNTNLGTSDRQSVEDYLNTKYSIY